MFSMFSALFGRKKGRKPWDELRSTSVTIPIWRSPARDGMSRFVFGISRIYEKRGQEHYAKTFEIQNIKDIFYGIDKLAKQLIEREDVPWIEQQHLMRIISVLDRVLSSPEIKSEQVVNGHGEPRQ